MNPQDIVDALHGFWNRANTDQTGQIAQKLQMDALFGPNPGGSRGSSAPTGLPGAYMQNQPSPFPPFWENAADKVGLAANFLAPRIPSPIRAYHGSPHDFNEFSLDKIGTGEGAQAYGHGLYFAENEGVARSYRDQLSPPSHTVDTTGLVVGNDALYAPNRGAPDHLHNAYNALVKVDGNVAAARQLVQGDQATTNVLNYWDTLGVRKEEPGSSLNRGHMYEVNLHATPQQFLDIDTPTEQQSSYVREALQKSGLQPQGWRYEGSPLRETPRWADTAEQAKALSEAGIPGIRYLDQGSRGAGHGSSNYVVWSPEIIEILRKYGLLGPVAGGATLIDALHGQGGQGQEQQ